MTSRVPLGQDESQKLEFMAADSLTRPDDIAKEVVAMLNAEGGEIWLGLREEGGTATGLDPIPGVARARVLLHDVLTDTISPSPAEDEVLVEIVREGSGPSLIKIGIRPRFERKPYARVGAGGWQFVTRVGTRLRPLSREEILGGPGTSPAGTGAEEVRNASMSLRAQLDALRATAEETFVLVVEPTIDERLDLAALRDSDYLIDPGRLGVRRFEFSVTNAAWLGGQRLTPTGRGVRIGRDDIFWLEISREAGILFSAPLSSFFRPGPSHSTGEKALSPLALLEYPTSVFRLLRELFSDDELWETKLPDRSARVLSTIAAIGIGGWTLRPRSPRDWSSFDLPAPRPFPGTDLVLPEPIVLTVGEIVESPDDSARRLWSRIYDAFGLWPEDYPGEFDRSSGRLTA